MSGHSDSRDPLRVAFVCEENAGRSQIAAAAVAEVQVRVQDRPEIEIVSGGTNPAEAIHPPVERVMEGKGYDLSARSPTRLTDTALETCDVVVLMGHSSMVEDLPAGVVVRDWGFIDPADSDIETVGAISTEIEQRVIELIDDLPTNPTSKQELHRSND
ncbi:low molecular weight phosphatase family protein [Halobaculum sp. MBLA0147]|uniref:arsenate-mycothiol transferase ArsC n=1 Tax=Halobaculum sp. MBLA0147 TaxID=3079934 RepID=UPI0035256ACB